HHKSAHRSRLQTQPRKVRTTSQLLLESAAEVLTQELTLLAGAYIIDVSKKCRCPLKNTFELRPHLQAPPLDSDGKGTGGRCWPPVISAALIAATRVMRWAELAVPNRAMTWGVQDGKRDRTLP